jgi:hypothetical protein
MVRRRFKKTPRILANSVQNSRQWPNDMRRTLQIVPKTGNMTVFEITLIIRASKSDVNVPKHRMTDDDPEIISPKLKVAKSRLSSFFVRQSRH